MELEQIGVPGFTALRAVVSRLPLSVFETMTAARLEPAVLIRTTGFG